MRINGEFFGFELGNELYNFSEKPALERQRLFHYTNVDSMLKILHNSTLKFNRIDSVNDLMEKKYFANDIYKLIFLSSFVYDETEIIPMWNTYTNNEYGVRLEFSIKEEQKFTDIIDIGKKYVQGFTEVDFKQIGMFGANNLHNNCIKDWIATFGLRDIIYDENILNEHPIDCGGVFNLCSMGIVKSNYWRYEKESRILMYLRTISKDIEIPDFKYFLVPIDLKKLSKINITFSPYMSKEIKNMIRNDVATLKDICEITFADSKLENAIIRK